jgi:sec-independent protein translocase protein TatC
MLGFCLKMMLAFGIGFQLPLIVYALGAMNLLSAETLVKHWRHASVVIFVIAAALTPSNDAFSMLMMAIPLVILFMISVWAVKLTQGRKKRAQDAATDSQAVSNAAGVEQ